MAVQKTPPPAAPASRHIAPSVPAPSQQPAPIAAKTQNIAQQTPALPPVVPSSNKPVEAQVNLPPPGNVSGVGRAGFTPGLPLSKLDRKLLEAAANFDAAEVEKALEKGANPNARRGDGHTALTLAAKAPWTIALGEVPSRTKHPHNPYACVMALIKHHEGRAPASFEAAFSGDLRPPNTVELLEGMISYGASAATIRSIVPVFEEGAKEWPDPGPFAAAAKRGDLEIMNALMKLADPKWIGGPMPQNAMGTSGPLLLSAALCRAVENSDYTYAINILHESESTAKVKVDRSKDMVRFLLQVDPNLAKMTDRILEQSYHINPEVREMLVKAGAKESPPPTRVFDLPQM